MFFRPHSEDFRIIGLTLGRVIVALGLLQVIPGVVALLLGEWNAASAFGIGAGLTTAVGMAATGLGSTRRLEVSHAMVVVALAWLCGALSGAIPLYLSGHFRGFLPAIFEAMSGFTTSGLSLVEDLDHLPASMNLWRHIMQFAGGQGIIVVVLGLYSGAAALKSDALYVGEAREEHIVPNVVHTARFIYGLAIVYLAVGTVALFAAGLSAGLRPGRALFHGATLFMAGFDTGGFSPYSASIAYYHSALYETILLVLMIAGALSFGLHYELWRRRNRELFMSTELRTLATSTLLVAITVMVSLVAARTFLDVTGLYRSGVFTVISAHTGTGFGVNDGRMYVTDWGVLAPAAIVAAMALGPMASSTGGGIKAIRVAIAAKGVVQEILRMLSPHNALVTASYHSRVRRVLRDSDIRAALTILLLYLLTYIAGGMVGLFYGHDFTTAFFESTSATANVGLSIGIVDPEMPTPLTVIYIAQMWIGRLEFVAVFALIAFGLSAIRGRQ